jgi:DNA-binding Lrp family transcriptional regulator
MSDKKALITAALKKLGPSSPRVIADETGIDPGALGFHLRTMAKAGTLTATGTTMNRVYTLVAGAAAPTRATPPQKRSKKARKQKRARTAAVERFIPAIDADARLVIVNGAEPHIFNPEQTSAIAALLLGHFEA